MTVTQLTQPAVADTAAVPYHQLARTWAGRWRLRPLIAVVLAFVALVVMILGIAIIAWLAAGTGFEQLWLTLESDLDLRRPLSYLAGFGAVALMLPATMMAVAALGGRPGLLSSVQGRVRWAILVRCGLAASVIWTAGLLVAVLIDPATLAQWHPEPAALALTLVVVLITPVQAAAEEYVFRGLLPQVIGSWLRHPLWAFLLPIPLFTFGHDYNLPGLVAVTGSALAFGWLTWRTGGLEAAIGLHVVNNTLLGLLSAAGMVDPNQTVIGWESVPMDLATTLAFVLWVEWAWRRGGLRPRSELGSQ